MASPAERLQLATLFGMLGTFLGILGVALALWLYQLQGRMQDQNESLNALAQAVERMGDNQRLANDTLVRKIASDKPEDFVAQYVKAVKERDEAVRLLDVQRSMTEDLGGQRKLLTEKLQAAREDLDKAKYDAKEAPDLRKQVAKLEEINDYKQRQLDAAEPILGYKEGEVAVRDLLRDLARSRYVAYAGWGISALLAAGLAATFFFYKPTVNDVDPSASAAQDGERPTHRIV
jgi:hypothetical protein